MFTFSTQVIIEQENHDLEKNISCLRLQILKGGKMPLVFFSHLPFSLLVIPLNFLVFNCHLQGRKKIQNYTSNYPFLSAQPLSPAIPWIPCLESPQAAQMQNVHREIFVSTTVSISCRTSYRLVYHCHHPTRQTQNPGAVFSPQFPFPVSTARTCHFGPPLSFLLLTSTVLLELWWSQ